MRLYRHNFTKDGKQVKSDRYYTDVRIEGRRYRLALFPSKSLSEKTARRVETLVGLKMAGETRPEVQINFVFESRTSAAKFSRRKVAKQCKGIWIQSTSGKGLTEFDGKTPRNRKRKIKI